MKKSSFAFATMLTLASAPSHVAATVIDYTFEGRVSSVQNLGLAVRVGDPFSASLRYDTALATGTNYGVEQVYEFPASGAYALNVRVGAYFGSGTDGQINILNDFGANLPSNPGQDWFKTESGAGNGFTGNAINGLTWTQTTLTFKDYQGLLYRDTSLPSQLADLRTFEESFATMFFSLLGGNGLINAQIDSYRTIVSNTREASPAMQVPTVVLPADAPGGMVVTLPAGSTTGRVFTATYSQQMASELDPRRLDFLINGDIFQVWDLHFDGTIAPGSMVDLVFTYDDTGMTLFDELSLDVLHEVNGRFVPLGGVVDTNRNTIRASTPSFSLYAVGIPIPEPGVLLLMSFGLFALALTRKLRPVT